jgi:hypothetical protein
MKDMSLPLLMSFMFLLSKNIPDFPADLVHGNLTHAVRWYYPNLNFNDLAKA